MFVRDLILLVVRLPLVAIGLYTGGLLGIVYARCVGGLLANLINMAMVRRLLELPLREQLQANIRALSSATLMLLSIFAVEKAFMGESPQTLALMIATMVTTGVLVYVGALCLLWHISGRPSGPENEMILLIKRLAMPEANPF